MTIKEFEKWYIENKSWLEKKARFLLSKTKLPYSETQELISVTMEDLLHRLDIINLETMNSYCFFAMRNSMYNQLIYPKRNECSDEYSTLNIPDEEYDSSYEERIQQLSKILDTRVKTDDDILVMEAIKNGKPLYSTGINSFRIKKSMCNLKNIGREKAKNYRKKKNIPSGRKQIYQGIIGKSPQDTKIYPNIKSVQKDGFTPELVRRCIKGELKQHKGYIWNYTNKLNN